MTLQAVDRIDIDAVAEGDHGALGRIYDRYAAVLLRLTAAILGDGREAEDLVHDLFVDLWQCAADYDPVRGTVGAWLRLKARSRAIDRLRAPRVARRIPLDPDDEVSLDPAFDALLDDLAERRGLAAAFEHLPVEQRTVLRLGYFEGLTFPEIAERTGVPLGTVKSRAAGALAKLRARFQPHAGGPR